MSLYTYKAKLIKVIDGDTVDVDIDVGFDIHYFSRVRLSGIDTPEIRTRNLEEKELGIAAKKYVEEWFERHNNECIIVTTKEDKGKYGRILGSIYDYLEESILNSELVDAGLARPYHGYGDKPWPEFGE